MRTAERRAPARSAEDAGSVQATFHSLTESTKPGMAHRSGIYLTPVRAVGDALHFRLLRCSTNLSGPTENFRATDRHIVDALNQEAALVFDGAASINHVLAQIYHNTPADAERKQAKARISAHADKTKDMPGNGVMAFCTFYEHLERLRPLPDDPFDLGHGRTSGLTRLRFRLKEAASAQGGLPEQFTLTLYLGSVFFMPLSTNRWYVHEIVPSELDAARLAQRIRACASLAKGFNGALMEAYTSACTTMGAHSDQALDLDDVSEIALFSCYERSDTARRPLRSSEALGERAIRWRCNVRA